MPCRMAHTYSSTLIHCVFSTKERRRSTPPEIRSRSGRAGRVAADSGDSRGVHLLDGRARRGGTRVRDYCQSRSATCSRLWRRKFFYLFTCEYCFQPLRRGIFLADHRLQAAVLRLARLPDRVLLAALGSQPVHGYLRPHQVGRATRADCDPSCGAGSRHPRAGKDTSPGTSGSVDSFFAVDLWLLSG